MSWQDLVAPKPSSDAAPAPAPAVTGGWRDLSTPVQPNVSAPTPPPPEIAQPVSLPPLDPRTATTGDYLARLHGAIDPIASFAGNYGRVAANALGIGDSLLASQKAVYNDVTGNAQNPNTVANLVKKQITGQSDANDYLTNLAAEKAKTAQASEAIGPAGTFAANMTGSGPIAGLNLRGTIADKAAPYVGKYIGGLIGGTAENALVGGAGAAGRNEDVGQGVKWGALTGFLTGIPGGVGTRGGTLPQIPGADTPEQLAARATQQYDTAGRVMFGPNQIDKLTNRMQADINQGGPRVIEDGLGAQALVAQMKQEALKYGGMSAERLNDFNKRFHSSLTGDANPNAGQAAQAQIDTFLNKAPPVSNHPVGAAVSTLQDANSLYGKSEDLSRINKWETTANRGGSDVGTQAQSWLNTNEGQRLAPTGSPLYDATQSLAATRGPIQVSAAPSMWDIRHFTSPLIEGGISGLLAGGASGWDPTRMAEGTAAGLLTGYGAHQVIPRIQSYNRANALTRALPAAKVVAATGLPQAPILPEALMREAIRRMNLATTAAGYRPQGQ